MSSNIRRLQRISWARWAQRMRSAADGSLSDFIELCCHDDHGHPLVLSTIHRQWLAHLEYCWERDLKAIIISPFGHGKSSTLAVPLIAYELGQRPTSRIKVVTNDDAGARKRVAACKAILEQPTYQILYPTVRPGQKWTDHELYITRPGHAIDPSVHARGVLTTGLGGRADLMVFDDVVDQKNSMDAVQRRRILQLIESTWLSRLEPDGRVLYISNLWHLDDATHHLMQRQGWCTLKQPIADDCQSIDQYVIGAPDRDYPVVMVP